MRAVLVSVVVFAAGCAFPQVVPEALSAEYKPTGEVKMYDRGATFDAVRVRSPYANLSKRTDGSWGGVLDKEAIDVSVTDTMVRGVNILLTREESSPGRIVITGQFRGRMYRFELEQDIARIRAPVQSLDFKTRWPIDNGIAYGPMKSLALKGEAAAENPPWPQLAFALIAMFD
jgi:hypothetical protein